MSLTPPTIAELETLYLNLVQQKLPTVDITTLSDYQAKGAGIGGIAARVALDAYTLFNAIYPQNGDSFGINTQIAALGIPSQYPASTSTLTVTVNNIPADKSYVIAVGTLLIAPNTQNYQVLSPDGIVTQIVINSSYSTLYLSSINGGEDTSQDIGTVIPFSPSQQPNDGTLSPIEDVTVISAIDGTDEESLSEVVNRLIQVKQTPRNGSSTTDFQYLAIDPTLGVTDAIVLINNELAYTDSDTSNVAIFDVSGTSVSDTLLNKGLAVGTTAEVFDRSVTTATYNATLQTIIAENVCGWSPVVNTVSTQALTTNSSPTAPYIKVEVSLTIGYDLTTTILSDGGSFSLYKIIQREVRRAICGQPYGASLTKDVLSGAIISSVLPTSAIEQQLDITLGTPITNGTLGNYLQSRSVLFYNGTSYEYKAFTSLDTGVPTLVADPIQWVYDISATPADIYYNIFVVVV